MVRPIAMIGTIVFASLTSLFAVEGRSNRCVQLMQKLVGGEGPSIERGITSHYLQTKIESVVGSTTGDSYKTDWRLSLEEGGDALRFGFFSAEGVEFSVRLKLTERENVIRLDLPRGLEREFQDLSLLKSALEHIQKKTNPGDIFEIIVNDPTIVEMLNETVADAYLKSGDIPSEPRRANFDVASEDIAEILKWNSDVDSFFPGINVSEGAAILKRIKKDESFSARLVEKLGKTEFGKAIEFSGDWLTRVEMRQNSRFSIGQLRQTETSEAGPVFALEWRIILEPAW